MSLKQRKAFSLLLLIVSPAISLSYALQNLDYKGKRLILTIFGLLYGLFLNHSMGDDAWTHIQKMQSYYYMDLNEFIQRFFSIITFNPSPYSPDDLYVHLLFGIAGSLFQSPSLLFSMVGAVYGYFYGGALLKVIEIKKEERVTVLVFILIVLFVILRGFENMQTIRSWTGMWVLFNGIWGFHKTQNKKYIFLIIFAPFFHLMYLFIALPALILVFFKSMPRNLIIGIYLGSFVLNVNTLSVINIASENQLAENKLNSYYRVTDAGDEIDPIAIRQEGSNDVWYAKYGKTDAVYYGSIYFIFLLIIAGFYSKKTMANIEYKLLSTGILMASLANFLSFSYAFYSRTMANASLYVLAVMVILALRGLFSLNTTPLWKRNAVWIGVLIFIPKLFYFASDIMYKTSIMILVFPFLSIFDEGYNHSVRDLIDLFL